MFQARFVRSRTKIGPECLFLMQNPSPVRRSTFESPEIFMAMCHAEDAIVLVTVYVRVMMCVESWDLSF